MPHEGMDSMGWWGIHTLIWGLVLLLLVLGVAALIKYLFASKK